MSFLPWRSGQTGLNLAHLCHTLIAETTTVQIADVCRDIGFDTAAKDIRLDDPFNLASAVSLVHKLDVSGQLGEFLTACQRHHILLGDAGLIPAEWKPGTLPDDLVDLLDQELGVAHEPYTLEGEWVQGVYQPEDTGCLCWPIPDMVIANGMFPTAKLARLDKIRALLGDHAVAYIGEKYEGGGGFWTPCYVVIPGHDQFNMLRVEGTMSEDDAETEHVIIELQEVSQHFPIDVISAEERELIIRVRLPTPEDIAAFGAWYERYAPRAFRESGYTLDDADGDLYTMKIWWDLG